MPTLLARSGNRQLHVNNRPIWLQSPADQREAVRKMALLDMSPATIASIAKMSVAEVTRILEAYL